MSFAIFNGMRASGPKISRLPQIDTCLICDRFRWQRSAGTVGQLPSSKKYGLASVKSICSVVGVVKYDARLSSNNKMHVHRTSVCGLANLFDGWKDQEFYINRFYSEKKNQFLTQNWFLIVLNSLSCGKNSLFIKQCRVLVIVAYI